MNFLDKFRQKTEIAKDQVEVVSKLHKMVHRRHWICPCGAKLQIRSRDLRDDGPSNYQTYPRNHVMAGHATLPADQLNWNGLAEERGWRVEQGRVWCPACQVSLSVPEYKEQRRSREKANYDMIR